MRVEYGDSSQVGLQGLLQEEAEQETEAMTWRDPPPTDRRESEEKDKERDGQTERQAIALGSSEVTRRARKSLVLSLTVP